MEEYDRGPGDRAELGRVQADVARPDPAVSGAVEVGHRTFADGWHGVPFAGRTVFSDRQESRRPAKVPPDSGSRVDA
ncbi:hypothetical protein GCM10009612_65800 [Streptomyces beijiangensis]